MKYLFAIFTFFIIYVNNQVNSEIPEVICIDACPIADVNCKAHCGTVLIPT